MLSFKLTTGSFQLYGKHILSSSNRMPGNYSLNCWTNSDWKRPTSIDNYRLLSVFLTITSNDS